MLEAVGVLLEGVRRLEGQAVSYTVFVALRFADSSRSRSLVYHLFVQLQAMPSWAFMAPQRVGEMTSAGPLTEECELTEKELDWWGSRLSPLSGQRH